MLPTFFSDKADIMLDSQTPDKLNEELDRILKPYRNLHCVYCGHKSFSVQFAEALAAITTAYAEAGYMTGEEWYEQFGHEVLIHKFDERFGYIDALKAARKAAGLLPNGKDE